MELTEGSGPDSVQARFRLDIRGKGDLSWNLTTGRAAGTAIEATFDMTADLHWPQNLFGTEAAMAGSFHVSGTTEITHGFGD